MYKNDYNILDNLDSFDYYLLNNQAITKKLIFQYNTMKIKYITNYANEFNKESDRT